MKKIVIMPGGFHPFHAGHMALYLAAQEAFPSADVFVAATDDTSGRPFPFKTKKFLAQQAGVPGNRFIRVKSPFRAEEITQMYDPDDTQLIFVRSEKDAASQPRPGGVKKDGTPGYLQPYKRNGLQPFSKHGYMAYLPTVQFGPGMTSATEIRAKWPEMEPEQKIALVKNLYPGTAKNDAAAGKIVDIFDEVMGKIEEDSAGSQRSLMGAPVGVGAGGLQPSNTPMPNGPDREPKGVRMGVEFDETLAKEAFGHPKDFPDDSTIKKQISQTIPNNALDHIATATAVIGGLSGIALGAYGSIKSGMSYWDTNAVKSVFLFAMSPITTAIIGALGASPAALISKMNKRVGQRVELRKSILQKLISENPSLKSDIDNFVASLINNTPKSILQGANTLSKIIQTHDNWELEDNVDDSLKHMARILDQYFENFEKEWQTIAGKYNLNSPALREVYDYIYPNQSIEKVWLDGVYKLLASPTANAAIKEEDRIVPAGGLGSYTPDALKSNLVMGLRDIAEYLKVGNYEGVYHMLYRDPVFRAKLEAIKNSDQQVDEDYIEEKWSEKYKRSIDCSHPKGFSQRAHCQGRKK